VHTAPLSVPVAQPAVFPRPGQQAWPLLSSLRSQVAAASPHQKRPPHLQVGQSEDEQLRAALELSMKEQSKVYRLAVRALRMPIIFCKDEEILESWLGNPVASVYCAKRCKPSRVAPPMHPCTRQRHSASALLCTQADSGPPPLERIGGGGAFGVSGNFR